MPESLKKIWIYIIPLALLGVVATCDSDFSIKNPFSKEPETTVVDSTEMDSDSVITNETLVGNDDTLMRTAESSEEDSLAAQNQQTVNTSETKKWRLVVGSLAERSRAEKLADETNHPQTEIMYVDYLSTYRVVYESFENLHQAQMSYSEVQGKFPNAWLVYY